MDRIFDFISLHTGEEGKEKVLENVKANISFRGSNLWILACAIVIASIGLNVNSTAVVIGAMLISPLMGPIVGAGFSLGIFDFYLLRRSLKNLLVATAVSLTVATVYFYLSPFKETQSELLARTAPNIYDVLIAICGGLVGVIAITRVEKGNPIPGVAIATALMPPLCTAGYGLATGNFMFFFGAMYLYTINCVFICIATFAIVKYLKYPATRFVQEEYQKKIKYGISAIITIIIIPSIYLAYNLLQQKKYSQDVNEFIEREFTNSGYTIIYKNVNFGTKPKKIELAVLSKRFSKKEIETLKRRMADYKLENTELTIMQDTTDLKHIIQNEISGTQRNLNEKQLQIEQLQKEIDANTFDNSGLLREASVLFPGITQLSVANHIFNQNTDSMYVVPIVLYSSVKEFHSSDTEKMTEWLAAKLSNKNVRVLRLITPNKAKA